MEGFGSNHEFLPNGRLHLLDNNHKFPVLAKQRRYHVMQPNDAANRLSANGAYYFKSSTNLTLPDTWHDLRNCGNDGSDQNINCSIDKLIDSSLGETFLLQCFHIG